MFEKWNSMQIKCKLQAASVQYLAKGGNLFLVKLGAYVLKLKHYDASLLILSLSYSWLIMLWWTCTGLSVSRLYGLTDQKSISQASVTHLRGRVVTWPKVKCQKLQTEKKNSQRSDSYHT